MTKIKRPNRVISKKTNLYNGLLNENESKELLPLERIIEILESRGFDQLVNRSRMSARKIKRLPTLAKIREDIELGRYLNKTPWSFIEDVNNVFEKVKSIFTKQSQIHKTAIRFQQIFSNQMDNLMEERGFCCGRIYYLNPLPTHCKNKCVIDPGAIFLRFDGEVLCRECFNRASDPVKVEECLVPKYQFQEYQCNSKRKEPLVNCKICNRRVHVICVLYDEFTDGPFCCSTCRQAYGIEKTSVRAAAIPATECDMFISNFLKKHELNEDNKITIRLLSESSSILLIKPKVLKYRSSSSSLNVTNWVLFTFFDSGNKVDICIFAIYVQLYENGASDKPDKKSAYISYIDSVNFLPSGHRTKMYRFILLGLFEFLKTKGFPLVYLWSCPPKKNADYIFNVKPPDMKIPTNCRLSKWYTELLTLGIQTNVISSFKGINDCCVSENWKDLNDVPYLEHDLWVVRMDEFIEKYEKQVESLQSTITKAKGQLFKTKCQESKSAQVLKDRIKSKTDELEALDVQAELWRKMTGEFFGFNTEYFVIKLDKVENVDASEQTIERKWLGSRHEFMSFFVDMMLEFSSERRAKYSTRIMLQRILVESRMCVECGNYSEEGLAFRVSYPETSLLCPTCFQRKVITGRTILLGARKIHPTLRPMCVSLERIEVSDALLQEYYARQEISSLHCSESLPVSSESPPDSPVSLPGSPESLSNSPDSAYSSSSSPDFDRMPQIKLESNIDYAGTIWSAQQTITID